MLDCYKGLEKNIGISLHYIPAHKGIFYNEKADLLAKSACRNKSKDFNEKRDLYECKNIVNAFYLKSIRPEIYEIGKNSRFKLQNLIRLKSGHCNSNSYLFKIGKHKDGLCEVCKKNDDMEHFLWSCSKYQDMRYILNDLVIDNTNKRKEAEILLKYIIATGRKI